MSEGSDIMEIDRDGTSSGPNRTTMTAEQRARVIQFEQWASRSLPKQPASRVILEPGHLSAREVREVYRIADACVKAHNENCHPTPEMLENFLAKVFEGWNSDNDPLPINPRVYPALDQIFVARGRLAIAHFGPDRDKPLFFCVMVDPENKACVTNLRDRNNGTVIDQFADEIHWRANGVVSMELKMTLGKALRQIDEEFQQHNAVRAIQYARDFIGFSSHGDVLREYRHYRFASTLSFVCLEFPMLWAAAADQLQPPRMWGEKDASEVVTVE
ncbi:hypothetical protein HIM_05837 [Hirsutella minnesotensis 3608]|uniref:Uncharacterized protein n=1 Tax=Hirsutella minnesotensis 3608 TaxID=1043627 RepID=A0A0F7ZP17_9HYPO|nr:hypothetical protein HIM_05837 [Hirsutella minnesotensis 3608]